MIGTKIKETLSSVGITEERVTRVGRAARLLRKDQGCGCRKRAETLDRIHRSASNRLKKTIKKFKRPEPVKINPTTNKPDFSEELTPVGRIFRINDEIYRPVNGGLGAMVILPPNSSLYDKYVSEGIQVFVDGSPS